MGATNTPEANTLQSRTAIFIAGRNSLTHRRVLFRSIFDKSKRREVRRLAALGKPEVAGSQGYRGAGRRSHARTVKSGVATNSAFFLATNYGRVGSICFFAASIYSGVGNSAINAANSALLLANSAVVPANSSVFAGSKDGRGANIATLCGARRESGVSPPLNLVAVRARHT